MSKEKRFVLRGHVARFYNNIGRIESEDSAIHMDGSRQRLSNRKNVILSRLYHAMSVPKPGVFNAPAQYRLESNQTHIRHEIVR